MLAGHLSPVRRKIRYHKQHLTGIDPYIIQIDNVSVILAVVYQAELLSVSSDSRSSGFFCWGWLLICSSPCSRAIKTNQDLLPETPWINIFYDDFWGTLLTHSGSHKSYRPLCTLSFRLNHFVGGLEPWGYHFVNVAFHGAVTGLFTSLARLLLGGGLWSLLAGLLFASHPIHTEAVAGVVGRADEGAALFFLLSLLCYIRHCSLRGHTAPGWPMAWFLGSLACAAGSMLWKELGVTVLAVSALYDAFVCHKLKVRQVLPLLYKVKSTIMLNSDLLTL